MKVLLKKEVCGSREQKKKIVELVVLLHIHARVNKKNFKNKGSHDSNVTMLLRVCLNIAYIAKN